MTVPYNKLWFAKRICAPTRRALGKPFSHPLKRTSFTPLSLQVRREYSVSNPLIDGSRITQNLYESITPFLLIYHASKGFLNCLLRGIWGVNQRLDDPSSYSFSIDRSSLIYEITSEGIAS